MAGAPHALAFCHTASLDGRAMAGHVAAARIGRLPAERPAGRGLAPPGMALASPGIKGPAAKPDAVSTFADGRRAERYAVIRPGAVARRRGDDRGAGGWYRRVKVTPPRSPRPETRTRTCPPPSIFSTSPRWTRTPAPR
ncbi:MAG: DUF411 domain-containing protein [Alphaproteobacteria bacterium]